jgi:hypothetical protein
MIQSDVMTYLYDPLTGGPPRAYECKLCSCGGVKGKTCILATDHKWCRTVTRTLSGMRAHQRIVHGFIPQAKLPIKEKTDADAKTALV